jgi:hypothetical protein
MYLSCCGSARVYCLQVGPLRWIGDCPTPMVRLWPRRQIFLFLGVGPKVIDYRAGHMMDLHCHGRNIWCPVPPAMVLATSDQPPVFGWSNHAGNTHLTIGPAIRRESRQFPHGPSWENFVSANSRTAFWSINSLSEMRNSYHSPPYVM